MFPTIKLLALSLLSATSLAAPAPAPAPVPVPAPQAGTGVNDPNYFWTVTGWSAGCQRGGCYYNFNVSAPAYKTIPAFAAYCNGGESLGPEFRVCDVFDDGPGNRGVAAHLLPAETGKGAHIEVSLAWTDLQSNAYYNYTGNAWSIYNQFVAPLQTFTITPSSAYGIS